MHKLVISAFVLSLFMLPLGGCAMDEPTVKYEKALTEQDLMHKNFVLESVNGKQFTDNERRPSIEFGEGFRVSGAMCNRYTGQGVLSDNQLTVRQMASTRMLCINPELNQLETDFSRLLMEGMNINYEGNTLILAKDGYNMVFSQRDFVQ